MAPRDLPQHDLLISSPACQGHTQARGTDKPHHDASRATAWCVVNIAEVTRPATLVVENVPGLRRARCGSSAAREGSVIPAAREVAS